MKKTILSLVFIGCTYLYGAETSKDALEPAKIKYRKGKDVNFEELLIQGQLKRPEISVVTGDTPDGTDGLLRLRENFLDRVAVDVGEEVP